MRVALMGGCMVCRSPSRVRYSVATTACLCRRKQKNKQANLITQSSIYG